MSPRSTGCSHLQRRPLPVSPAVVSSHCQRECSTIPCHRGGQIHRLSRCHNHTRQAGRHGPPLLRPRRSIHTSTTGVTFAVGIGVGTFTLTMQIFTLNIKAEAQKSARSEDYGMPPPEREGAQHYRSTHLPIYGIGRSFETFGWVPPVTLGWGGTSGCATLWGCSIFHTGKNIVNGSNSPCNVRTARAVRALCTNAP